MNPRKPTQLKIADGTFREDRAVKNPMQSERIKIMPSPHRDLPLLAKRVWRDLGPRLCKSRILHESDLMAFEQLCILTGILWKSVRELKSEKDLYEIMTNKSGAKNRVQNIHLRNYLATFDKWKSLSLQFGLTPSARAAMSIPDLDKEDDPIVKLFSKNA